MVDSKALKISTRTITKDLQMLRLVSDNLKTKKMFKQSVKSYRS